MKASKVLRKAREPSHGNPVARQSEVILSRPVVEHAKVSVGHYVVGLRDVPAPPERVSQI